MFGTMIVGKNPKESVADDPSPTAEGLVIKKTLSPIQRNGANNPNFNPYAVQNGDVIRVVLEITGTGTENFGLDDNLLHITYGPMAPVHGVGGVQCIPSSATGNILSPTITPISGQVMGDHIVWSDLLPSVTSASYYCKITDGT